MGLIDIADAIATDFVAKSVNATVYFGEEFLAQNDAANRIVFVPTRDKYDRIQHMGGSNPRPLLTRRAGARVQIWASSGERDPKLKRAADWRALDALINAFIRSLNAVNPQVGAANGVLGGEVNTKTKLGKWGIEYMLDIEVLHPIVDAAWEQPTDTVLGGHTYLVFNGTPEQADA